MNEIKILVRTQNSAKSGFEGVNKDIDKFAKDSSETFSKTFGENVSRTFTTHINEAIRRSDAGVAQAGDRIGQTLGQRISTRITENIVRTYRDANGRLRDERGRFVGGSDSSSSSSSSSSDGRERVTVRDKNTEDVHVSVDVDRKSVFQQLAGMAGSIKEKVSGIFGDGMKTGITSVFSGDVLSTLLKGALVTLATVVLAPAIGGAITSGILLALGGGVIGVGVASALKSYTVKNAFADLKKQVVGLFGESGKGTGKKKTEDTFGSFGSYFTGPVVDFVSMLTKLLEQLKPTINDIGRAFGPVADSLAHGIIGFLQNALPGIMRAIKASGPLIETLADELPGIGDAIGKFFDHIKNGAPSANVFFNDLLNAIPIVIRVLGILIEAFARMYTYVRYAFFTMVNIAATWAAGITSAAAIAFGWVPGLGPKLDTAARKAAAFKEKVNKQLNGIHDVDISVRIRTFGLNTAVTLLDVTHQLQKIGAIRKAAGGAVGQAASGGPRSNRVWVGEQGPELVDLAPGSRVYTAGDSQRMAGQGGGQGGGGGFVGVARVDAGRAEERSLIDALVRVLRVEIFNTAGGDVQMGLGS